MNHVPKRFSLIVSLVLSQFLVPAISTTTKEMIHIFPENRCRVTIGNEQVLKMADRNTWEFLEDMSVFSVMNSDEKSVLIELGRLGIQVYAVSLDGNSLKLKYERPLSQATTFEETYSPCLFDPTKLHFQLTQSIENNWLLRSSLILNMWPESASLLSNEFLLIHVFLPNSVHKHLIFRNNPKLFMNKFLDAVSTSGNLTRLSEALKEVLNDLKIEDSKVQIAFDDLLNRPEFKASLQDREDSLNMFPILLAFVSSKRSLIIDDESIKDIIFGSKTFKFVKERLYILKLDLPPETIESIILKLYESDHSSTVFPFISANKRTISKLSSKFILEIAQLAIKSNDPERIKLIFSNEFNDAIIRKITNYGKLLANSIYHIGIEALDVLTRRAVLQKSRFPLFSRKDLVHASLKAIQTKRDDLFVYFLENGFICLWDQTTLKSGRLINLLAAMVLLNNFELLQSDSVLKRIKWNKCFDSRFLGFGAEAKGILKSIGAPECYTMDAAMSTSTTNQTSQISSKRSTDHLSPEQGLIDCKRPCAIDPVKRYEFTLETRNDAVMYKTLRFMIENGTLQSLKNIRGFTNIVWELYDINMLLSLDLYLGTVVLSEEIVEIFKESARRKCSNIIRHFLATKVLQATDRIDDRNLIAYLLKTKNADLAIELIKESGFDIRTSDSPQVNPEGDILLSASWSPEVMAKLLEMGASPNVKFYHLASDTNISLLEWALTIGRTEISNVLLNYVK